MTKRKVFLIQDPYDDDAIRFIEAMFRYFGLRPVCLFSDRKARFYGEQQFPLLRGKRIEASYDVNLEALEDIVPTLKERYEVAAVVPYREDTVEVAARLCSLFDLSWNTPEILKRFRNKHALKSYIKQRDPGVRVPRTRLVRSVGDLRPPLSRRVVVKPNDGYGNRAVGIFSGAETAAIATHLAQEPNTTWVAEEYIGGREFSINGQVRGDGSVTILTIFEYERWETNDYPTVYRAERHRHSNHPLFAPLSRYAERLIKATGLARCPFHLEVKVDGDGPCAFDLGARVPSEGGGLTLSRLHPNRPDVYAVAAHDYLGDNSFATEPVDYTYHDSQTTLMVYGISHEEGMIENLVGIEEVEAMPEFVNWAVKPRVGDPLLVTQDLRGAPYIVELSHDGDDRASDRLIEKVHRKVRWNRGVAARHWLRARAENAMRRARPKLHWLAHNIGW